MQRLKRFCVRLDKDDTGKSYAVITSAGTRSQAAVMVCEHMHAPVSAVLSITRAPRAPSARTRKALPQ